MNATGTTSIIGFDSAWTDNPRAPGAICTIRVDRAGRRSLVPPRLASFDEALTAIEAESAISDLRLVALDQPALMPNATGMRPVDRVAASLISWLGGGVQPANRGKAGMFDDAAPLWRFKERLGAIEDPEASREATRGLYLMEVFPALAMPSLDPAFDGRLCGPRYNPARRKTFTLGGWKAVIAAVRRQAVEAGITGLAEWADALAQIETPRKADQDRLDSVLCALIGLHWHVHLRDSSIMIGDGIAGYMVTPASPSVRARLEVAAKAYAVPVDPERYWAAS